MSEHVPSQCDQCGKWDDHPKSHWNSGQTFHHDCLPAALRAELIESHPNGAAIVEAAESGTRGEELRAHIVSLHTEENV